MLLRRRPGPTQPALPGSRTGSALPPGATRSARPMPNRRMMIGARIFASTSRACRTGNLPSRISVTEPRPIANRSGGMALVSAFSRLALHRGLVDIHPQGEPHPELQRADGQDPGTAAHIDGSLRGQLSLRQVVAVLPRSVPGKAGWKGACRCRMPCRGRS